MLCGLVGAPWLLSSWGLSQLSFVAIYVVAGTGLMLLAGYAGQLSLCHAAFLGVGAYAEALLQARGWPLEVSLPAAAILSALAGTLVAWSARRQNGIYLAIITLSCGFVLQEVAVRWETLTGGNAGLAVLPAQSLVLGRLGDAKLYGLAWGLALVGLWLLGRLLRSSHGRALVALREDPTAVALLGIAPARAKMLAFALAGGSAGLAGALYAHKLQFISPEQFDWVMSIELLMMLTVGGLGSRAGIVFGAFFLIALPQFIGVVRDALPTTSQPAGMELFAFGAVLVLSLRYAPNGLAGALRRHL
jgi:branched-chain amino acid transport system permease protein